ncbi:MAG: LysR substrate-binding domain-containing protein [Acidobacteriota bacterium]
MTPTQARAFLAVALKGSFSGAARSLHVSQPTVTNQVQQIEKQYNIELFFRTGRGTSLTPAGETLLPYIRRMFSSFEEATTYLDDLKGQRRGHLKIGSYGPYDVMKVVSRYRQRFPMITLSVDFMNSERLIQKILNFDLDVAFVGQMKHQPQIYTFPFARVPLVVIAPRVAKWIGRKSISAKDLEEEMFVRREPGSSARVAHDQFLEKIKIPTHRIQQFGSREGIINAVAEGVGIGTIFDEGIVPEDRVVKIRIAGPPFLSKVDIVCLADRRSNPLISTFLEIAQELIDETRVAKRL